MAARACRHTACLGCVTILTMVSLAVVSLRCVCGVRSSYSKHTTPTPKALHYLTLGILVPLLLSTFANLSSLTYEGSSTDVSRIMDWHELAGCPTSIGVVEMLSTQSIVAVSSSPQPETLPGTNSTGICSARGSSLPAAPSTLLWFLPPSSMSENNFLKVSSMVLKPLLY